MSRPFLPPELGKSIVVSIRFNQAEFSRVQERAGKAGCKVRAFIRSKSLGVPVARRPKLKPSPLP